MSRHLAIQKRRSCIANSAFPFEILHIDGPARNMQLFDWHDFWELSLIRQGKGTFEIEDSTFVVQPDDVVMIDSGQRHRVHYRPGLPLYECVTHFGPSLLAELTPSDADQTYSAIFHHHSRKFVNVPPLSSDSREAIKVLFNRMREEYSQRRNHYQVMLKGMRLQIVSHILRACEQEDNFLPSKPDSSNWTQADAIRIHIRAS